MSKTLPTVSIVIPCYNEEHSLPILLQTLQRQTNTHYILEEVRVICDGCTDTTASRAIYYQNSWPKIQVIEENKRLGKTARINQALTTITSDLLILCDADIELLQNNLIDTLILEQQKHGAAITTPSAKVIDDQTFLQKSIAAYEHFWRSIILNIRNGQNVHTCLGCFLVLDRKFYSSLTLPTTAIADDHYLFFAAKKRNLIYHHVPSTSIGFVVAASLSDYVKQTTRYLHTKVDSSYTTPTVLEKEYFTPPMLKIRAYVSTAFTHHLYFFTALWLQILVRLYSKTTSENLSHFWDHIGSTKRKA